MPETFRVDPTHNNRSRAVSLVSVSRAISALPALPAFIHIGPVRDQNRWMRGSLMIGAAVLVGACTQSVSAGSDIDPSTVRANWELSYQSAGPPIAIELGELETTEAGWAEQELEILGAQIEYVVDLQLADTYRLDGSELIPAESANLAIVKLGHGDIEPIRINFRDQLPTGTSVFTLVVPVWINASEVVVDDPHDQVEITLTYTVRSPEEQSEVAAFCDEAVPITNGRTPSLEELDELSGVAEAELSGNDYEVLTAELEQLVDDLDAFLAGPGGGYSTSGVNDVIGRICNVNMLSESAIKD